MWKALSQIVTFLYVLLVPFVSSEQVLAVQTREKSPRYLFTFGDSYTETGFNANLTWPSVSNPLGNPSWPGNTSSGGVVWVNTLLGDFADPVLSYNFARGGATVDEGYAVLFNVANPFDLQIRRMAQSLHGGRRSVAKAVDWTPNNSAFIVWFGVNDIGIMTGRHDEESMVSDILVSYFRDLSQLYGLGARRFILMGAPPLWRTPMWYRSNLKASLQFRCKLWNIILQQRAATFQQSHPGTNVSFMDTITLFDRMLNEAEGCRATDPACADTGKSDVLWHDGIHPGQVLQRAIGKAVKAVLVQNGFYA